MTIDEDILQGVRTALKTVLSLTDDDVRAKFDKGAVEDAAFLSVGLVAPNTRIGSEELIRTVAVGVPKVAVRSLRRSTVSINGYGSASAQWLQDFDSALARPDVLDLLETLGLTLISTGNVSDLSEVLDTSFQKRYLLELECRYLLTSSSVSQVEATNIEITNTFVEYEDAPNALTITTTHNF